MEVDLSVFFKEKVSLKVSILEQTSLESSRQSQFSGRAIIFQSSFSVFRTILGYLVYGNHCFCTYSMIVSEGPRKFRQNAELGGSVVGRCCQISSRSFSLRQSFFLSNLHEIRFK